MDVTACCIRGCIVLTVPLRGNEKGLLFRGLLTMLCSEFTHPAFSCTASTPALRGSPASHLSADCLSRCLLPTAPSHQGHPMEDLPLFPMADHRLGSYSGPPLRLGTAACGAHHEMRCPDRPVPAPRPNGRKSRAHLRRGIGCDLRSIAE
jgi:hypothetical protein